MTGPGAASAELRSGPAIGVALKLAPRRVDVDPLSGEVTPDRAPAGPSPSGLAALEIALRLRDAWNAQDVRDPQRTCGTCGTPRGTCGTCAGRAGRAGDRRDRGHCRRGADAA